MDLKELENVINYLQDLRREEEKKQLEKLEKTIKEELFLKIDDLLNHFESDIMIKFLEDTQKNVCFSFNYDDILKSIKEKINVDVWELK